MINRLNQWHTPRAIHITLLTLLLFYSAFTAAALLRHDGNPLWFVWIGEKFQALNPDGNTGYDGQFVYYIALDGFDAAPQVDLPAYRFQRIGLPLLVRALSFGQPAAAAWALIIVNLTATIGSTFLLARWLQRQRLSPLLALAYGLYIGTFMAYSRDLTEPLAYFWAIWGVTLWLDPRRGAARTGAAVMLFALAALTKEPTLLLPIGLGCAALVDKQWRRAAALLLVPLPFMAWQVVLWQRFGAIGVGQGSSLVRLPLWGILSQLNGDFGRISALLFVALPAAFLLLVALFYLRRTPASPALWMLLIHAIFVVLLPPDVYDHVMHAGRNAAGLVVAAIFAFPLVARPLRWGLAVAWIAPTLVWAYPVLRWAPWLSDA